MIIEKEELLQIRTPEDVVRVRQEVRARTIDVGFSLIDQTKLITAASEIARNTVIYGGGGNLRIQILRNAPRRGVRLIFQDQGPGIPDLERALTDGFTSGNGLGLGLGGARRLSNEFDIHSKPGEGTTVSLVRWKS